jgi:ferric-dicitrate binding protein FerR (iron transport regulator)
MECEKAQILSIGHIMGDSEFSPEQYRELQAHLAICPVCAEEYESNKETIEFVLDHKDEFSAAFECIDRQRAAEQAEIERSWKRIEAKLENLEAQEKRNKFRKLFVSASVAAACLVIGIFIWMTFPTHSTSKTTDEIALQQTVSEPKPFVKIELVKPSGNIAIDASQAIVADDELKTLRINGNRQMVLNVGTELSIEPYNLGCIVKLDKGEIYTEVEHDGKLFIVESLHGRAVITGTTFNIKADQDKMDLAVIEGSVRFESDKGAVIVKGGFQSSIIADMKPSIPVTCDAVQIAQWAKRQRPVEPVQMYMSTQEDLSELAELSLVYVPYCELEDVNFDRWIDQRREWFEREFPWTKRLQKLLAQDETEVDTIDLLIESKDLWRFAWPEYSQHRILAEDKQIIQEIASHYGVEIDKLISAEVNQCKQTPNIEAFEKWLNAFKSEESNLAISSIHTCVFLINMRSLTWYGVNDGHIQVENKQQVLALLSEQVQITSNMLMTLNQLLLADKGKSVCLAAQYDEYIKKIREGISLMITTERELIDDEIISK